MKKLIIIAALLLVSVVGYSYRITYPWMPGVFKWYPTKVIFWSETFDTDVSAEWSESNCTMSISNGYAFINATGVDPVIYLAADWAIDKASKGRYHQYLVMYAQKTGAGTSTDGVILYETPSHGQSGSYYKSFTWDVTGSWAWYYLDMHDLNAGGTDWKDSKIINIRIDLPNAGDTDFNIGYVGLHTYPNQPPKN